MKFLVYTTVGRRTNKPLFVSNKYRESFNFFKTAVELNKSKVFFPLKYVSNPQENKMQRYYIVLVKELDCENIILKTSEYLVEEKFYVYGLKKRIDFISVLQHIVNNFGENFTKVYRFKNKIVFEDGERIECVLTKNLVESKRFYFKFKEIIIQKKIISFLFLGNIPNKPRYLKINMIQRLVDFTGLSHYQFKRNSTRH